MTEVLIKESKDEYYDWDAWYACEWGNFFKLLREDEHNYYCKHPWGEMPVPKKYAELYD